MTINRMRGAVALPEAGEGVVLRFLSKDRDTLRGMMGEGWFDDVILKLSTGFDEPTLKTMVKFGAKRSDGTPVFAEDAAIDLDDIGMPLADIATKIVDAMCVGAFGRTYQEQFEYVTEQMKKADPKSPPAEGPMTS